MQMILYTEIHRYWIMNERDSTLEALLLVSNKPIGQSFDWRSNGREHLPVTQTKLLCREGLLCAGVRDGKCFREYAEIKGCFIYIYILTSPYDSVCCASYNKSNDSGWPKQTFCKYEVFCLFVCQDYYLSVSDPKYILLINTKFYMYQFLCNSNG